MRVPRGTSIVAAVIGAALGAVVWSEWVHARASTRRLGTARIGERGHGVVVVLGFADPGPTANSINRWRARMAVRSAVPGSSTIITSGGSIRGSVAEATLVARHIRSDLGWDGPLIAETASTSTWENVRNVIPDLEAADWIVFASNALHAERAREYLGRQRPDLAARLVRGREQRFGEMAHVKPLLAMVGLLKLRALR